MLIRSSDWYRNDIHTNFIYCPVHETAIQLIINEKKQQCRQPKQATNVDCTAQLVRLYSFISISHKALKKKEFCIPLFVDELLGVKEILRLNISRGSP